MSKAGTFKNLRNRLFMRQVSLLAQAALFVSLFLSCICGPFCCDALQENQAQTVAAAEHGCCSSCATEENSSESDCSCKVQTPAFYTVETTELAYNLQAIEWTETAFEIILPSITEETGYHPETALAIPKGPPPYLRFEVFLI
jgi:hypothetical protein